MLQTEALLSRVIQGKVLDGTQATHLDTLNSNVGQIGEPKVRQTTTLERILHAGLVNVVKHRIGEVGGGIGLHKGNDAIFSMPPWFPMAAALASG